MANIPLPEQESNDIFSYGFDKNLYREVLQSIGFMDKEGNINANFIAADNLATISSNMGAITGGSMAIGTDNLIFKVDGEGNHWAGNADFSLAPFSVTNQGALVATSATITGTVTATAGSIGGWTINATSIIDSGAVVGLSSAITGGDDIRFWAGNATPVSAPFYVTEAGVIKATSGTVGGWTLGATSLTDTAGAVGMSSAVTAGDDIRFWAGNATPASAPFRVTEAGVLNASSGTIGGFTITATELYGGIIKTAATVGAGSTGVIMDTAGLRGYDSVLGLTFELPTDGGAPTFSSGIINETIYEISTNAVLRTSSTVGDGSASSAGLLINNTGLYGCEANQLLADANVKLLVNGTLRLVTAESDAIIINTGGNIALNYGGDIRFTTLPAASACTASLLLEAGNIDVGTHDYIVTFVNDYGETNLSNWSNQVTNDGTHKQNSLTSIPISSNGDVTARKIYRTKAGTGVGSVYYLLTTIGNNSATTYTDNTADANLGVDAYTYGYQDNSAFGRIVINNVSAISLGDYNLSVGRYALDAITTGYYNTAFGSLSLTDNTTGKSNTAVGGVALYNNISGSFNTAVGRLSLNFNETGANNTAIGYGSGNLLETGSGNIFIGYNAGYSETGSNKLYIENSNSATPLIYGEFDNDLVYIHGDLYVRNGKTLVINSAGNDKKIELYHNDTDAYFDVSSGSLFFQVAGSVVVKNGSQFRVYEATNTNYIGVASNGVISTTTGNIGLAPTGNYVLPSGTTGTINLGSSSFYWADVSYKTLTDRGCLGSFDMGVEMLDGKILSDAEALLAIETDPNEKTIYGAPKLKYDTFPKVAYKEGFIADRDYKKGEETPEGIADKDYKKGEQIGIDGVEMTSMFSIMIGAIRELTDRIKKLEDK